MIVDSVSLRNLEAEQEYTLKGMLADPETGKMLNPDGTYAEDGKPVEVEKTFTAEASSQEVRVEFKLDSARFEDRKIVVLESLYMGDILIFSHGDLDDEGQTVTVVKRPDKAVDTGDPMENAKMFVSVLVAMLASGIYFFMSFGKLGMRRKIRKNQSYVSDKNVS